MKTWNPQENRMMKTPSTPEREHAVLGQKYAFATASLMMGIASFISLLGFEKAVLAVAFGWLARRSLPGPALTLRRRWAKARVILGLPARAGVELHPHHCA